jgi:hypothetical protein
MTTLTQSDLDDLRRKAFEDYCVHLTQWKFLALLDHIAQLTAERDEAKKEIERLKDAADESDENYLEIIEKYRARIAALEAQPSAQPNDDEVERAARALCDADGIDPDYLCHCDEKNGADRRYAIDGLAWKAWEKEARAAVTAQPSAQFVAGMRVLKDIVRLQKDIQADVSTAHRLRGSGASEWMRDDDRDMRRELDAAFSAARAILAEAALKGEGK